MDDASPRRKVFHKRTQLYIGFIAILGVLAISVSIRDVIHEQEHTWLRLAALILVSGWLSVKLPSTAASISISEAFEFTGTLLFGRSVGTILVLLDVVILCSKSLLVRRSQLRWQQILFNLTGTPLSLWVAATLTGISQPIPATSPADFGFFITLGAFTLSFFLLNSWIVTGVVAFDKNAPAFQIWWNNFKGISVNFAAGASIAAFLFLTNHTIGLTLVWVIVPLLLVIYLTYTTFTQQIEQEQHKNVELKRVFLSTVEALALAIDAKDQVTHGHIRRVQRFTMALATALGVQDEKLLDAIRAAALLHDTGKLAVPEYILNKPGPLTSAEFERMKVHAAVGADILKSIDFPYPVEPIVRHHHESWDGNGYPSGLAGTAIPLGARVLSVVDCYDALTSDRPYRPRMTRRQAEQVLRDRRGTMYDPWVVDEFLMLLDRLEADEALSTVAPTSAESHILSPAQLDVISATSAEEREFNELRRELPKAQSLDSAAAALFGHLRRVLSAASFALYKPLHNTNDLRVAASFGIGASTLRDLSVPVGDRISGWCFAHQQTVFNSEASLELGPVARTFSTPLKYVVAVPLMDRGPIGVLVVFGDQLFHQEHRRLIESAVGLFVSTAADLIAPTKATMRVHKDNDQHSAGGGKIH
jgi:putative nucleotidyltransferase with HDIG domain